jgi:hypothetical protein
VSKCTMADWSLAATESAITCADVRHGGVPERAAMPTGRGAVQTVWSAVRLGDMAR